ncbi:MAG: hypothetical protein WD342_15000 [Verrucomicrobiales bacterium]
MAERPSIQAVGRITRVHEKDRLYEVEMANGFRAYAIRERKGPALSSDAEATEFEVVVDFSPYNMGRCKIVEWRAPAT